MGSAKPVRGATGARLDEQSSVALLAVPSAASAATVTNGDFETGTLSGWQTQATSGGNWFAYSGFHPPINPLFIIAAPPQGSNAAVTDQSAGGTHILYQDVALAPGNHTLSLYVYYNSQAAIAHPSPDSLSSSDTPNQQYRIDVMKPSAPLTSIDPADILLAVFRTATGDPPVLLPTMKTADLTPFAGQTVRLRFAEVANQGFFNASTDAVSIASTAALPPVNNGQSAKKKKCKKKGKKGSAQSAKKKCKKKKKK